MTLARSNSRDRERKKNTYSHKTNNKQFWLDLWIDVSESYAIIFFCSFAVTVIVVDDDAIAAANLYVPLLSSFSHQAHS